MLLFFGVWVNIPSVAVMAPVIIIGMSSLVFSRFLLVVFFKGFSGFLFGLGVD